MRLSEGRIQWNLPADVVANESGKFRARGRSIWNRTRFQLGAGLLLAVLLPWAIRVRLETEELGVLGLQFSLAGTTIALIAGYFAFRRLSRYPGVRASYPIVPAFAVSYGLVLI